MTERTAYAEALMDTRMGKARWGADNPRVRTSAANWKLPLRWNAQPFAGCNECGWRGVPIKGATGYQCAACLHVNLAPQRRRVFCASLADVFDNEVDPQWRADLLELIDATPNLDWLLLTKRIGNVVRLLTDLRDSEPSDVRWGRLNAWLEHGRPPENVWLGATICNQAEADRDIPKLLATPAAVRFVSIEPMLGPVDVERYLEPLDVYCPDTCDGGRMVKRSEIETWQDRGEERPFCPSCGLSQATWESAGHGIDWVIAGGESGAHARPSHPDWFRSLRDQCAAAGVAFMFKQWGEWAPGESATSTLNRRAVETAEWFDGQWNFATIRGGDEFDVRDEPDLYRAGKKAAGRLLDGVEHNGFPEARR